METVAEATTEIGRIFAKSTEDLQRADRQGQGFAYRTVIARRAAAQLAPQAERLFEHANAFTLELHKVDLGLRAFFELGATAVRADPQQEAEVIGFFQKVAHLAQTAEGSLDSAQGMADSVVGLEALSRDLRPPLRRIRQGLTLIVEARAVMGEWIHLMRATGIRCEESEHSS